MTIEHFSWFIAGLCLGAATGLSALASEQRARDRQVRSIVAAYEAKVAEILGRLR